MNKKGQRGGGLVGVILPLAFLGITLGIIGGIAERTKRQLAPNTNSPRRRTRVVRRLVPPTVFSQPRLLQTRRARFRRTGIV